MTGDWEALAGWWRDEVAADPAYRQDVLPLLLNLLAPAPGSRYLDLGCGEGQGMRAVRDAGGAVVGCDLSHRLLAGATGARVRCRLPDLEWVRPGTFDGAYAVLVLEHLDDGAALFRAARGAVRTGGVMAAVLNHPVFTAPGAGPFVDPADGETLWRWGRYLAPGTTEEPAGRNTVAFHHRPLGVRLEEAAAASWSLERLVERPVGEAAAARDPLLAAQRHVPRLLGVRWRATSPRAA